MYANKNVYFWFYLCLHVIDVCMYRREYLFLRCLASARCCSDPKETSYAAARNRSLYIGNKIFFIHTFVYIHITSFSPKISIPKKKRIGKTNALTCYFPHLRTYIHTYITTYIHKHTYIHTYIHTHTYIDTCIVGVYISTYFHHG